MKQSEKKFLSWIKYILQLISITIFSYILLADLFHLIKPGEAYIDLKIFNISYLRFILFLGFISGLTGWTISLFLNEVIIILPTSHKLGEKTIYALIAFFFAVFYNGLFGFLKILQYPLFILSIILFYFFIPQLIEFYSRFNFNEFKLLFSQTFKLNKKITSFNKHSEFKKIPYLGTIIFILLSLVITIFSFIFVSKIVGNYMLGRIYKENQLRYQIYINKITPQKVVHAQKVKLDGYNLGWKTFSDSRYQIMTNDGPIRLIEKWTNEQLEFTVSLDMPLGKKQLWIEKPSDNLNNKNILKSNAMYFYVLDRFIFYPAAGDSLVTKVIKRIKKILFFDIKIFNSYIF